MGVLIPNDCDGDGITVGDGDQDDYNECVGLEVDNSSPSCKCPEEVFEGSGSLSASLGVSSSNAASGLPDGNMTGNISGDNDLVTLSTGFIEEGGEICVTLGYNNPSASSRITLNGKEPSSGLGSIVVEGA